MKKTDKNNYFSKDLWKNKYCWFSLLLSLVLLAGVIVADKTHVLRLLIASKPTLISLIVAVCIYGIVLLGYTIYKLKYKELCFADTLIFSSVLFACLSVIYGLIFRSRISLKFVLLFGAILLVGIFFVVLRAKIFSYKKKEKSVKTKTFITYIMAVLKRYSVFAIIVLSVFVLSGFYIILNKSLSNFLYSYSKFRPLLFVLWGLCTVSFLCYYYSSVVKKRINTLDALLVSTIIAGPLALNYAGIMFGLSSMRFLLSLATFIAFVLILIIRYFHCDINEKKEKNHVKGCYVKKVVASYNPALIVTLAIFAASFGIYYYITGGIRIFASAQSLTKYFSWFIVTATLLLLVLFGFVYSLITIREKQITITDFFTLICYLFSIFAFGIFMFRFSVKLLLIAIFMFVISSVLLTLRVYFTKSKNKKK